MILASVFRGYGRGGGGVGVSVEVGIFWDG